MGRETFQSKCIMILIAINASLPSFYIGYSIVYFASFPFETIHDLFNIKIETDIARGILNGSIQIGALIGALMSSLLFQLLSRKHCYFAVNVFAFLVGILLLVQSFQILLIARLCQGICVGLYSSIVPLYIKEISPVQISGTLGSFFQLFITIGIFVGAFLPYLLIKISGDHTGKSFWHIVFAFPEIVIITQTLILAFVFPYETPKYLLSVSREAEARELIQLIYKEECVDQILDEKVVDYLLVSNQQEESSFKQNRLSIDQRDDHHSLQTLKTSGIAIHLTILQQFSGINTVIVYGSVYAKQAVTGQLTELMTSLINLEQIIATLISGYLLASFGRKTLLTYGALFQGLSSLLIMIGFQLKISAGFQNAGQIIIVIGLFVFIGVFGLTLGPLVWIYIQDIAQPSIVPFTTGLNWGLSALVVILFPLLIDKVLGGHPQVLFLFFALWCLGSFVINGKWLVQTKGKSQKEIQEEFENLSIC